MSKPVREYQRVSNVWAGMTWAPGDRINAQVAADSWERGGERSILSYNHTKREYTRVGVEERANSAESEEHSPGTLSHDLEELRAEVKQLHQEVEFWRKGASTWRECALEYWDAGGKKQEEELVERVARCFYDYWRPSQPQVWGELSEDGRAEWLRQARAAIKGEK